MLKASGRAAYAVGLGFFALAAGADLARARPLQIIHTNDLHSHLDHARDPARGGYAAVKATINRLKGEARSQGVDTLVLDAGDFSEDSEYYLADEGLHAWEAVEAMGYDAVTLGNHDWLMGARGLDDVVGRTRPTFALLGANFLFTWESKNLVKYMKPWLEVTRSGARIAVYGLTTNENEYNWQAKPALIYNPVWSAEEDVPKLRARNDYVIALTHLGVASDKELAMQVGGIDLVVGGHSHTLLPKVVEQKGRWGNVVPVVQTGMHGNYVGDLLVDVEPGKPLQVLRYQLVPVYSDGERDAGMAKVVDHARERLEANYGAEWLKEIVGFSEVPLLNAYYQDGPTAWSDFVGQAMLDSSGADAAIDVYQFEGFDQPAGPITREQLFVLYPRILEFDERLGYTIWTTQVQGWILELAVKEALKTAALNLAGITADIDSHGNAKNIKINGAPIQATRSYKIAVPEAVARGALGITRYLKLLLRNIYNTRVPIWTANERYLRKIGGTIKAPAASGNPWR